MKSILFFFLLITSSLFPQKKQIKEQTIYINAPECSIKATVFFKKKNIKAKESRTYYWYSLNEIHNSKGGYDGKLLSGPYTCFYLSNNLKEKGEYKTGLKNSKWINWHPNGLISDVCYWKHGLRNGLHEKYDANGMLLLREEYKNDLLEGFQMTFKNDSIISKKEFKKGKEVIASSLSKEVTEEKKTDVFSKVKIWYKEKATKKEKEKSVTPKKEAESKTPPPIAKKTFKEKVQNLFKKKPLTKEKETASKHAK